MITSYVAVMAGNKKQFDDYVRQGGLFEHEKAVYAHDSDCIRGFRFSRYEVVGTFYEDNKEPSKVLSRVKERMI